MSALAKARDTWRARVEPSRRRTPAACSIRSTPGRCSSRSPCRIWLLAVLPMSLPRRRDAGRAVARVTCRALGLSVVVDGELPDSARPYVIAANHSSFIDGLVLYVFLNEPVTFVSSTDMEHQFLLGRIMRGFGCVFVDRGRAERSAASVEKLVDTIHSGQTRADLPRGFDQRSTGTARLSSRGLRGGRRRRTARWCRWAFVDRARCCARGVTDRAPVTCRSSIGTPVDARGQRFR